LVKKDIDQTKRAGKMGKRNGRASVCPPALFYINEYHAIFAMKKRSPLLNPSSAIPFFLRSFFFCSFFAAVSLFRSLANKIIVP